MLQLISILLWWRTFLLVGVGTGPACGYSLAASAPAVVHASPAAPTHAQLISKGSLHQEAVLPGLELTFSTATSLALLPGPWLLPGRYAPAEVRLVAPLPAPTVPPLLRPRLWASLCPNAP